jgi:exopolyphosphatase/guanosine-5'-triphosphate,3'-diphosphate pyrophosphatase
MGRSWQVIDEAEKPVALGVDVFGTGAVSRESMLECLQVVRNFQELLATYRLEQDAIHVIATSAIRVARNRDIFVDRLRQETGFVPEIVDGIEETRLMYLAVRSALGDSIPEFWKSPSMIVDMGGGSTEIMLLRRGKIVAAHSLRLGSVLVGRQERMAGGNSWFSGSITTSSRDRYLEERVRNTADFLNAEMNLSMVQHIVLAGGAPRPLALLHGDPVNDHCMSISRAEYCKQVDAIRSMSIESSARRFNIPITEAEGFVPGNIVYRLFLESTAADAVIVPFTNIREGILLDRVIGADTELQNEFAYQTIASAVNLGRKYHFDEPHS